MARVSPNWINDIKEEVRMHAFVERTTSYNPAAAWLVSYLSRKDIPCKVINLGAGVKRIILAEYVCPHCKGKGYLKGGK